MYPFSTLLCMKMIERSEIGLAWVEMLNLCKNEILGREITFYRINVTLFGKFKEDILKQHLTFYFIPPWASVDFNHCSRRHLLGSQTSVVKSSHPQMPCAYALEFRTNGALNIRAG